MIYLLKYRSRGKTVQLLQELLNAYDNNLEADGYFGRMTEQAVKAFQQKNNLGADGVVYTQTWAKLLFLPPTIVTKTSLSSAEIDRLTKLLIKLNAKGKSVEILQTLLNQVGYNLDADGHFGRKTDTAVKDFQRKNNLTADGIVYTKTWAKLFEVAPPISIDAMRLSDKDIIDFAKAFNLEIPVVKAVQEVESSGRGFLADNRPTILFEGHIFWKELEKRGIDPRPLVRGNENVLYSKWTKDFYEGKAKEYTRLEKAKNVGKQPEILEAALASCSWGMFQIMGFNYHRTESFDVLDYVVKSRRSEAEHLTSFGHFIEATKLLKPLREKQWATFARGYNGRGYKQNRYDERLKAAYLKHSATPLLG